MLVNVTRFDLTANFACLGLYLANDTLPTKEKYPTTHIHVVLTKSEVPFAIECARGKAEFYPWFDDIGYHVRIHPHGIDIWKKDGFAYPHAQKGDGVLYNYHFVLPGDFIAEQLQSAYNAMLDAPEKDGCFIHPQAYEYKTPEKILKRLKRQYAPSFKYDYANYNQQDWNSETRSYEYTEDLDYLKVENRLAKDLQDTRQTRLQACLDGFERIALNHSDGVPSIISLRFDYIPKPDDTRPMSYIWYVKAWSKEKGEYITVIWGGLIAHPNKDGESWEYSTHT